MGPRTDRWRKTVRIMRQTRAYGALPGLAELVRDVRQFLREDGRLCLCIVDVDDMHQFNQTRGYGAGDEALLEIGRYLQGVAQELNGDARWVYRFRGDEFALVVPGATENMGLDTVRRIHEETHRAQVLASGLTLSAGCATAPQDGSTVAALLMTADARMAFAKLDGIHTSDPNAHKRSWIDLVHRRADYLEALTEKLLSRIEATDAESDYLAQLAFTDALTGLPNHRALRPLLDELAATGERFAVLFVDGDGLKAYNSRFGYDGGDEMIRALASVIAGAVPDGGVVGRWLSGDEFLVVVGDEEALRTAHAVREAVRQAAQTWPLPVTVSIGMASYPAHATSVDRLLKLAAQANDRAKRSGKDRVVVHSAEAGSREQ